MSLKIIEAEYYTSKKSIDCTEQVRAKVANDSLSIVANNDIVGDPEYGKRKKLRIRYMLDGREREKIVQERCRIKIGDEDQKQRVTETVDSIVEKKPIEIINEEDAIEPVEKKPVEEKPIEQKPIQLDTMDIIEKPNMTDIIIPSYQNEHLTVACFESIKANTQTGTYRIIWVDNGSRETKKAKKALKGTDHLAIMLKTNTGFVNAINTGLAKSTAPIVCFLNNDTEVSKHWLDKLTDILYAYPKLGIVGPLTGPPAMKKQYDSHHNVSYQQRSRKVPVFPYYKNLEDFNTRIEAELLRVIGDISFVAFLCAVIKREVIEKVTAFHPSYKNGLDEGYEMGMWDDCDYNWAIGKVGYKKAIALDTCIIHKGRSTFNLIQSKEKFDVNKLLKTNRKYMDNKMIQIEKDLKKCTNL